MVTFHKYQEDAIDFAMNRLYVKGEPGAGLLMSPGLGKTLCTLEIIRRLTELGEVNRTLVTAPLRVLEMTWPQEITKFGFGFKHCRAERCHPSNPATIDFCSPDSLHRLMSSGRQYDLFVADESTKFKAWSTRRMKTLRKLLPSIPKRMILTGTPMPNHYGDLHSQIYIVDNGLALGKNVTTFRSRFCQQGGWHGREWKVRDDVKRDILDAIAPLCIRLDSKDCLELPELHFNRIECAFPAEAERMHKELKRELSTLLQTGERVTVGHAAAVYVKLKQVASGFIYGEDKQANYVHSAKLTALGDLVEELGGKPIVVFYNFDANQIRIQETLGKCAVLKGGLSTKEAGRTIQSWLDGKHSVLLAQLQAASFGLNLQVGGCTTVAFYEMNDSAGDFEQAYRRIYRQGAGDRVVCHKFICRGTVDEIIDARVAGKLDNQEAFLDALKQWSRG